jgi:two-component system NarL family sensor kinase
MKAFTKSERKILISVLSILIILCSLAYLSHRNSNRMLGSAEQVDRAQEIKYHIEQLIAVSADLETGARGYVITGDENYLEPSNKSIASIFEHIEQLKKVSTGNPVQLNRIADLEKLVDRKVSNATRTIEIRRNKGLNEAIAFVSSGENKSLMDQIRAITGKMMEDEDVQLKKHRDENQSFIRNFNLTFDLLLIKIAITILAIFFVLKYYFKERRKSDELLRENKELLETVIDNTSSVISIKDVTGRYLMINRQYERLFHRSKKDMKGKTDYDIFPKEIADDIRHHDIEVIKVKKVEEFEEEIPSNGSLHHYLSIKFPLFDNEQIVYAVCTIATDITERKKSVEAIIARSDAIMDLFNNAPCGYQSSNKEGIIIEMNDTALNWLGYVREEVINKLRVRDILSAESMPQLEFYFPKIVEGKIKSLHDIEVRFKRKDGTVFPVLVNSVGYYDEEGKFSHTKTSVFDITLLKQSELIISQN